MIRLGEHDIETNPDCTDGFCADPVIDITPGEIIIPVNTNFSNFKHDIAIIRLSQKIKFSGLPFSGVLNYSDLQYLKVYLKILKFIKFFLAFVKPICFVHGNIYSKNLVGTTAEVAGWGIYDIGTLISLMCSIIFIKLEKLFKLNYLNSTLHHR